MRSIVILFVILALVGGCSKEEKLAAVDGRAITPAAFEAYLKFKRLGTDDQKKRGRLLAQYVERAALAAAVEKTDLLDKALIAAELEESRKELLISRYFEKYLQDKVSEDAVRNYYNTHAADYEQTQAHIAHILIRTNAKMSEIERKARLATAREAHALIRSGKDFSEIAAQYSEDKVSAKKGGDLGWIVQGGIDQNFSRVAFELAQGAVSEPFETPYGYHVVTVLEAPRTVKRSLDTVAGSIRLQLRDKARKAELERLKGMVKVE